MYYEAIMTRFDLDDQGKAKKITERFLLDALSITEAVNALKARFLPSIPTMTQRPSNAPDTPR